MAIKTIGINLGKTVFVAVALDGRGRLVGAAKRYGRTGLVRWLANLPPCLIGMEASSGAHHLARTPQGQGHAVRLLPGQAVKPFRGATKNDAADALAIAEAAHRPGATARADQERGATGCASAPSGAHAATRRQVTPHGWQKQAFSTSRVWRHRSDPALPMESLSASMNSLVA